MFTRVLKKAKAIKLSRIGRYTQRLKADKQRTSNHNRLIININTAILKATNQGRNSIGYVCGGDQLSIYQTVLNRYIEQGYQVSQHNAAVPTFRDISW